MTGTSTPRRQEDEVKESPLMSRDCVYAAGGVCETHGAGAKRYWRPRGSSRVRGVGGSGRKIPEREYYYQCDLGPRGGRKLWQSRLSFTPARRKNDGQE